MNHALTHAQVLTFPDYQLPFMLVTDASSLSVSGVLMRSVEGKRPHVIAYDSRLFTDVDPRYSNTHLEALAAVWVLKYFKYTIYGYPITIYTDHTAVINLFKGKNLQDRVARWFITSGI